MSNFILFHVDMIFLIFLEKTDKLKDLHICSKSFEEFSSSISHWSLSSSYIHYVYHRFVLSFEMRKYEISSTVLFQGCFCYLVSFEVSFHMNFKMSFSSSAKIVIEIFIGIAFFSRSPEVVLPF